jgi:hypothetical protein
VPVRIIFRGLILFHFPDSGDDKGKLVAMLINNRAFAPKPTDPAPKPGHGKHEHSHSAEIQILDGANPGKGLVPINLEPDDVVDIVIPTQGAKGVKRALSFDNHVPNLGQIIAKGTPAVQRAPSGQPDPTFVQNWVVVDCGVARVREVAIWDESGYPLNGVRADRGKAPSSPVLAKFMGSSVQGHMASEIVVEVDDADSAEVTIAPRHKIHSAKGTQRLNHGVSPETVEILIANYEFQRGAPAPWSLDFQWMFEAAGYRPVELGGDEFRRWEERAAKYNSDLFTSDRELLLKGTMGLPFPYVVADNPLVPFRPLTDEHDRPLCIMAIVEASEKITMTDGTIIERTFRITIPRKKIATTTAPTSV